MSRKSPTIRAIWLGEAMRRIRDEAGLTSKEAGAHVERDGSSITRIEGGEMPVSEDLLQRFMDMCGVTDPHERADLEAIRRDAAQTGWWDGYRGDVVPTLLDRTWVESKASSIHTFDMAYLPGLLQTPEYAEGVMRAVNPDVSDLDIRRWLEVRITRQNIIIKHHPTPFQCIIDEQLLRREVGDTETMSTQLDYLLEVSERKNIDIRILSASKCFGTSGSFEVMKLVSPYPVVGYVASPAGDICIEGETVGKLTRTYDRLLEACLSQTASRKLIETERNQL